MKPWLQSYGPQPVISGVKIWSPKVFKDDAGEFRELLRVSKDDLDLRDEKDRTPIKMDVAQVNLSTLEPGAIKAFHIHKLQTDLWYVIDKMIVFLYDNAFSQPETTMRLVLENQYVLIPPGVGHGIANPYNRPGKMMYFTDGTFNPEDEFRDNPFKFGECIWKLQAG